MRKLLHLVLITLGYRALWLAKKLDPTGRGAREERAERRVADWYADPRHVTLQYDYPLDKSARVFDVGGFEGNWAAEILMRFDCRIDVFEPVPEFANHLRRRFAFSDGVTVNEIGLGGANARLPIAVGGERSSFVHDLQHSSGRSEARIRDIVEFLDHHQLERVELLKLNIEGAEYDLLERLLEARRVTTFDFILVQFHDELPDAATRAATISRRLEETHELMWRFPFVWESWRKREAAVADQT